MQSLAKHWPVAWEMAKTDFRLRYAGSGLGYIWALLKPLALFLILSFVFSHVFHRTIAHYPLHLFTGIIFWTYFSEGTRVTLHSLVAKSSLITRLPIEKLTILFASWLHVTITFVINIAILACFYFHYGVAPSGMALLYAIFFWFVSGALIIGFGLAASVLYVRFRDLSQLWEVILQFGFYAAPIIYPLSLIPEKYQLLYWLNPMSYVIHYVRDGLLFDRFIPLSDLLIMLCITAGVLLVGGFVYKRLNRSVPDYL